MERKSIFIVNPDKEMAELLGQWLKVGNYDIEIFSSLEEIGDISQAKKICIFIVDIDMPDLEDNYLGFCARLKNDHQKICGIVMTYKRDFRIILKAIESGVEYFIFKPIDPELFKSLVSNVAKKVELKQQGNRVLDAAYINYLTKYMINFTNEELIVFAPVVFNMLILGKLSGLLEESIVADMFNRVQALNEEFRGIVKYFEFQGGKFVINDANGVLKNAPIQDFADAFRDFTYGFLQLAQLAKADILI